MEDTGILVNVADSVAEITLNRPERHNAFDEGMIAELTECFTRIGADTAVRAIVLRGAGKSFCGGADLGWMRRMAAYSREENLADARALQRLFAAMAACPQVTIARVHGAAMGGGMGLVAVCDLGAAAHEATFALSEVRLGLAPAVIAPYVVEKIGPGATRALSVTGERIDASEAHRLGLVQQVVPASELDGAVARKLESVLQAGPQAIGAVKRLLRAISGKPADQVADQTAECIATLRASEEGQEGMRAFFEKRKPHWTP
jgi:methylglutaconyl-CoA hydratase